MKAAEPELVNKDSFDTSSEYAIVYQANHKRVLFEKQANIRMEPASMTKVMSALVAFENIKDLDASILIQEEALVGLAEANASTGGFQVGESVTYRDLLYGCLLPSGADATKQLALSLFGSEQTMVDAMNKRVVKLGLENTHFMNTSGLHSAKHYTTLYDLSVIMQEAISHDELKKMMSTDIYSLSKSGRPILHTMAMGKSELGEDPKYLEGGKSGFTLEAGTCFISYGEVQGELLIVAVAKASLAYDATIALRESEKLYAYIDKTYEQMLWITEGELLKEVPIKWANETPYKIKALEHVSLFLPRSARKSYMTIKVKEVEVLEAPIKKGTKIAEIIVYYDKEVILTMEYTVPKTVTRNGWYYSVDQVGRWFQQTSLLWIGLILGGGSYAIYMRKRK